MRQELIPGVQDAYGIQILQLFQSAPPATEVVLFGSRAKGNYREGSDIDIAVKGPGVTLKHRDEWLAKYEDLNLPWKLDLVVYQFIEEPELKAHIDRVGKILRK